MVPWKQGKPLVWDATCPDTLAPSFRGIASINSGAVAAAAEERKVAKYSCLDHGHSFTPVAIETWVLELGRRVMQTTGEQNPIYYNSYR